MADTIVAMLRGSVLAVFACLSACAATHARAARAPAAVADSDPDHDRITAADRCPNEPETYNGFEDDDGCPDRAENAGCMWSDTMHIAEQIPFPRGVAQPAETTAPILDALAAVLQANRQLDHVAIVGSTAPDETDASLATQRANNIRAALIARGVANDRLEAHGFDSTGLPSTDRDRRAAVWFVLVEIDHRRVVDPASPNVWRPYRLDCQADATEVQRTGRLPNCDCVRR